jgi:Metallo-beta-lactamase superfamily
MATLDWYGCATFRLRVGATVIFLDAYIDRVPAAAGTGLTAGDIEAADWILVGHSHFDHLWGAERIAARTGATIVGSYETVRVMAAAGVPDSQLLPVSGGELVRLSDEVTARVYPSLHSCVWSQPPFPEPGQVCLGDLGVTHQERLERFRAFAAGVGERRAPDPDTVAHLRAGDQHTRGDGGALVYLLNTHPRAACSTRTPPGTTAACCGTCGRTWRSWPPPAGPIWTASRCRAASPTSSPPRPRRCCRASWSCATTTTGCPG